MSDSIINVSGPWITEKEIAYVKDAAENAWYSNAYMYHEKFERAFCEYTGRKFAIALPSCTAALHLAMLSLGLGRGDEVIVPDITWIASVAPVTYVGARPVFADIDRQSWCLSPESFERRITKRTKAVIPVDLYGNMADMDSIIAIAQKHGIAVIEDAAEAAGASCKGRMAGSFGEISTFSFHGSKTLTTGEGGMLLTDSKELHDKARFFADHGKDPGGKLFWNLEVAYKYKMSSMQAALGLAQLERIDELIARKREIFSWYAEELKSIPGIEYNRESADYRSAYWMVSILWDEAMYALTKERFLREMGSAGITCRPFFYPLSSMPAFTGYIRGRNYQKTNKVSYAIADCAVNLPSSLTLSRNDVQRICRALAEILSQSKR